MPDSARSHALKGERLRTDSRVKNLIDTPARDSDPGCHGLAQPAKVTAAGKGCNGYGEYHFPAKSARVPNFYSAPSVVVGIDGSRAAANAAVWAVDEAISRQIPLRLVYVIDPVKLCGAEAEHIQYARARMALYAARGAVESAGKPVKIETTIVVGKPIAKLAEESWSAQMLCIGSPRIAHVCPNDSSVAMALPRFARCPVAVIRPALRRAGNPKAGHIVVEPHDGVVLRQAFWEASLRRAPLRVVSSCKAEVPDDLADETLVAQPGLNRRIQAWKQLYPDVKVEPTTIWGSVCEYLANNPDPGSLFVVGTERGRCDFGSPARADCSVLTVGRNRV
ncbi:universal stress protein [uncultured Mycobacterium sp.]|uniref:universal stress protein n=1 Tax=uncultured Mycobacterium sp. TaxID=171292 RepID=UPI0035CA0AF4